jgi:AbrB family looped-hinge helix DNA binding protein
LELGLTATVTVTRKGQTTIPKELRDKYGIREGTRLDAIDVGDGVLLRKSMSSIDLIGSSKFSYEQLKSRLDAIRREDA